MYLLLHTTLLTSSYYTPVYNRNSVSNLPVFSVSVPLIVYQINYARCQKLLKYCIKSIMRAVKNCLLNSLSQRLFDRILFNLTFIYCSNLFALSPGCLNVGGFRLSEEPKFWATACVLYSGNYMGVFLNFLYGMNIYLFLPCCGSWELLVRIKSDSFNYPKFYFL